MTTKKEIHYRGINLLKNEELNYLEWIIDDTNTQDQTSYIITLGILTEYCEKTVPDYLVLNKLHSDYILPHNHRQFTDVHVFSILKSFGVRNFILLVNEKSEKYDFNTLVREIKDPYMIGFKSVEDMENWMRKQNK